MSRLTKKINQTLQTWHYWMGALFALVFTGLAITGFLINHSNDFDLDSKKVSWLWLNWAYNVKSEPVTHGFEVNHQWAAQKGQTLYLSASEIGSCKEKLIGALTLNGLYYFVCQQTLLIVTSAGELVERMTQFPEPFGKLGIHDQRIYAFGAQSINMYYLNDDESGWEITQAPDNLHAIEEQPLPPHYIDTLSLTPPALAPTWERALLDAHSGRLFGKVGVWIVDLTGMVLIFSSLSGFWMWFRKFSKQRQAKIKQKSL